jgi:glycosyltransferase involved in cell wall biosynthesis
VIIIPALNEAERVGEVVAAVSTARPSLEEMGCTVSICLVDDGSRDDTAERARQAGVDRVIGHSVNQGLGAAVRTGLAAARADGAEIVVKLDADLQHDPADIAAMVRPLVDGTADVVYGNRFQRLEYRMPLVRRLGNAVFTALLRWLTRWPVRDGQPGIFAVNRAYLDGFFLPGDYNYTQQILVDAYHRGLRFAHVPVTFRRRTTGASFISYRYPFKVLPQIVLVLAGVKPMKVFAPIGVAFLVVALAVFGWELGLWLTDRAAKPVENVNLVLGTGLFGLQTLFFGILAELIVRRPRG